jgi:hypothetical protein
VTTVDLAPFPAGVHDDMPPDVYHADPAPGGSLSSTGARMLLAPSCPAKYRWYADHGQAAKKEFDLGHAAHSEVLGVGESVVVVDADSWRTKKAKEEAAAARAAGAVPLLAADWQTVLAMADALRAHPIAGPLLAPGSGRPELSLFWPDLEFGVQRRARLDWLRPATPTSRALLVDYKTTDSAAPADCARSMEKWSYHQQLPWYLDGLAACGLACDPAAAEEKYREPAGVQVFQEKTPPHLVTVCEPDADALAAGRDLNRRALDTFARCQASGVWPGYAVGAGSTDDQIVPLSLPRWSAVAHEAARDRGDFDTEADTTQP